MEWDRGMPARNESDTVRERLHKYRPTVSKKIVAWTSVGLGTLMLVSGLLNPTVTTGVTIVQDLCIGILISVGVILPGAYWFYRNHADQHTISEWQHERPGNDELRHILGGDLPGSTNEISDLPFLPPRRWGIVAASVFTLWLISGIIMTGPVA